jgi:RES domain-containing protein
MISAWRLVHKRRAATAFGGDGARRYGGRWNSKGQKAIYLADSLALAVMEIMVHAMVYSDLATYVYFKVQLTKDLIRTVDPSSLPHRWRDDPAPVACKRFGDLWLADQSSAVLRLPTVVLPEGSNYIINPEHPDFGGIQIGKPKPLAIDRRISHR